MYKVSQALLRSAHLIFAHMICCYSTITISIFMAISSFMVWIYPTRFKDLSTQVRSLVTIESLCMYRRKFTLPLKLSFIFMDYKGCLRHFKKFAEQNYPSPFFPSFFFSPHYSAFLHTSHISTHMIVL